MAIVLFMVFVVILVIMSFVPLLLVWVYHTEDNRHMPMPYMRQHFPEHDPDEKDPLD